MNNKGLQNATKRSYSLKKSPETKTHKGSVTTMQYKQYIHSRHGMQESTGQRHPQPWMKSEFHKPSKYAIISQTTNQEQSKYD